MADRYYNPFQTSDIDVPAEFHKAFTEYCHRGNSAGIDQSPFPRMVDLWFLSVCVAARLGLEPVAVNKSDTRKIIDGAIFSSDPWRIHLLMLIAISKTGDVHIVSKPGDMIRIANSLAAAGLPKVIEMLKDGDDVPIWNLSESIDKILRKK